jgi:16S rRNA (uracil1498-N3)-methyltransferase
MKLHRFYLPDTELEHDMWLHDQRLIHQWRNVLRFKPGQQVVLFDGQNEDRLYRLEELSPDEAHIIYVTDLQRVLPKKDVYLLWSLLKKDKNDWVLQKGTELGVSHFMPLLAERSEKTGFNLERAEKIVIEAAEQCGRSDIPNVREPMHVETAIKQLNNKAVLYICEQDSNDQLEAADRVGVLIGPEGGWSDNEKALFKELELRHLALHDLTLRAETATLAAVTLLMA